MEYGYLVVHFSPKIPKITFLGIFSTEAKAKEYMAKSWLKSKEEERRFNYYKVRLNPGISS